MATVAQVISTLVEATKIGIAKDADPIGGRYRTFMMMFHTITRVDIETSLRDRKVEQLEIQSAALRVFWMVHVHPKKPPGFDDLLASLRTFSRPVARLLALENPLVFQAYHELSHETTLFEAPMFGTPAEAECAHDWAIFNWNEALGHFGFDLQARGAHIPAFDPNSRIGVRLLRGNLPWLPVALPPNLVYELYCYVEGGSKTFGHKCQTFFEILKPVLSTFYYSGLKMRGDALNPELRNKPPFREKMGTVFEAFPDNMELFDKWFHEQITALQTILDGYKGVIVYLSTLTDEEVKNLDQQCTSKVRFSEYVQEKAAECASKYTVDFERTMRRNELPSRTFSADWSFLSYFTRIFQEFQGSYQTFVAAPKRAYAEVKEARNVCLANWKAAQSRETRAAVPAVEAKEEEDALDSPLPATPSVRIIPLEEFKLTLQREVDLGPGKVAYQNARLLLDDLLEQISKPLHSPLEVIAIVTQTGQFLEQLLAAFARKKSGDPLLRNHSIAALLQACGYKSLRAHEASVVTCFDRAEILARSLVSETLEPEGSAVNLMQRAHSISIGSAESFEGLINDLRSHLVDVFLAYDSLHRAVRQKPCLRQETVEGFMYGMLPLFREGPAAGAGGGEAGAALSESLLPLASAGAGGGDAVLTHLTSLDERAFDGASAAKANLILLYERLKHERAREYPTLAHHRLSWGLQLSYVFLEELVSFLRAGKNLVPMQHRFEKMMTKAMFAKLTPQEKAFLKQSKNARGQARYAEFREPGNVLNEVVGRGRGAAVPKGDTGVVLSSEVTAANEAFDRTFALCSQVVTKLLS